MQLQINVHKRDVRCFISAGQNRIYYPYEASKYTRLAWLVLEFAGITGGSSGRRQRKHNLNVDEFREMLHTI